MGNCIWNSHGLAALPPCEDPEAASLAGLLGGPTQAFPDGTRIQLIPGSMETHPIKGAVSTLWRPEDPNGGESGAGSWGDLGECQHHIHLPKPAIPLAGATFPGGPSIQLCPQMGGTQVSSYLMAILWHKGSGWFTGCVRCPMGGVGCGWLPLRELEGGSLDSTKIREPVLSRVWVRAGRVQCERQAHSQHQAGPMAEWLWMDISVKV